MICVYQVSRKVAKLLPSGVVYFAARVQAKPDAAAPVAVHIEVQCGFCPLLRLCLQKNCRLW
jgi:hypothetical protein